MQSLLKELKKLKKDKIQITIDKRLKEFESVGRSDCIYWFSELCFCILTANSRAQTAIAIQKEITPYGFQRYNKAKITSIIKRNKHRFHNNKAQYIIEARDYLNIKHIITDIIEHFGKDSENLAREWLAKNIKGLGFKEASHFMRNIGYKNLAIIDRHILDLMCEHGICKRPKTLDKKAYLDIERDFKRIAENIDMNLAELDLYMWYMKTGQVLK